MLYSPTRFFKIESSIKLLWTIFPSLFLTSGGSRKCFSIISLCLLWTACGTVRIGRSCAVVIAKVDKFPNVRVVSCEFIQGNYKLAGINRTLEMPTKFIFIPLKIFCLIQHQHSRWKLPIKNFLLINVLVQKLILYLNGIDYKFFCGSTCTCADCAPFVRYPLPGAPLRNLVHCPLVN